VAPRAAESVALTTLQHAAKTPDAKLSRPLQVRVGGFLRLRQRKSPANGGGASGGQRQRVGELRNGWTAPQRLPDLSTAQ
jgi:hypothetical protein